MYYCTEHFQRAQQMAPIVRETLNENFNIRQLFSGTFFHFFLFRNITVVICLFDNK